MTLYGLSEIAEALGENYQTVAKWRARGKLPRPTAELAMGPVWWGRVIEPWIEAQRALRNAEKPPLDPGA